MAKETAEEKLLKMLQKTGSPVGESGSATLPKAAKKKFALSISIQTINQMLIVGIIVCVGVVLYQMREGIALLNQSVDVSDDEQVVATSDVELPSPANVSTYLNKVTARNIFKPYDMQSKDQSTPAKKSLVNKMSKYKLVGVSWLDLPETASVMIEDTTTKQTYFLKQDEQIEGVTVKTIYTDRVVFGDENEETTIKL